MSSTTDSNALSLYDLYILDNGGIPLFAGCTSSNYCKQHLEEHPLHTGFIAAITSFGNDVFSGYPEQLNFRHLKLTFKVEESFTIVMVNPQDVDDRLIQEKLKEVTSLFKGKYKKLTESAFVSDEFEKQIETDLIALGLAPQDQIQSTKSYFITDKGESSKKSQSLIDRFKQKFSSLVKK